jgi:hypothetical protein
MSEYQEEVLTNLIDLQAELRGDEPPSEGQAPAEDPAAADDEPSSEAVAVREQGVTVSVGGTGASSGNGLAVNERLAALNERLARLESDLAGVTKRIERIEPEEEPQPADLQGDVDAPWRSFLDLQKIVADRLDDR